MGEYFALSDKRAECEPNQVATDIREYLDDCPDAINALRMASLCGKDNQYWVKLQEQLSSEMADADEMGI